MVATEDSICHILKTFVILICQIRSMALFIMNKAYCGMNKPVPIPLSEIARLFAIDEIDEVFHTFSYVFIYHRTFFLQYVQ